MDTQSTATRTSTMAMKTQRGRSSGRVGATAWTRNQSSLSNIPAALDSADVLTLYQRLLELRGQDDSELSKAINYGLKLFAQHRLSRNAKGRRARLFA